MQREPSVLMDARLPNGTVGPVTAAPAAARPQPRPPRREHRRVIRRARRKPCNVFQFIVARVCFVSIAVAGCATNPATGEQQLSLISKAQEIQLGRQSAQQVQQTLGFVEDSGLQNYVARIGHQLAVSSERPDLPWEFHVVDDPTPNAFALPGGFIYITRGMVNLLTSEAEGERAWP